MTTSQKLNVQRGTLAKAKPKAKPKLNINKIFSLLKIKATLFISLLLVVFVSGFLIANKVFIPSIVYVPYTNVHISGMWVNEYIKSDVEYYVRKYAEHEKISFKKAEIIINLSIKYEVPVNNAFSVAYCESGYNERAISGKNKNGTFDYGLYQLNSNTFPDVEKLLPIDKNASQGLSYYRACYDKTNSWDLAYISYNAGSVRNYDRTNKENLKKLFDKARELDEWFSNVVKDKIIADFNKGEILK